MSKKLIQDGIAIELITLKDNGESRLGKTHAIIAGEDFWEMLEGLYIDEDRPDGLQKADEVKLRYKDLVFVLQKNTNE